MLYATPNTGCCYRCCCLMQCIHITSTWSHPWHILWGQWSIRNKHINVLFSCQHAAQAACALFEMNRSGSRRCQPVELECCHLALPLSLSALSAHSLCICSTAFLSYCPSTSSYAKLTKSKVAARFDELKVNLPCLPSPPASPRCPLRRVGALDKGTCFGMRVDRQNNAST